MFHRVYVFSLENYSAPIPVLIIRDHVDHIVMPPNNYRISDYFCFATAYENTISNDLLSI